MAFSKFIYEQGIIGVTIGTITGFAISNFIKDLKSELIIKILNFFNVSNAGLFSSLIEFSLLLLIVYLLYEFVLYPIFNTHIEKEKTAKENDKEWKKKLLYEVKSMDLGNVYM